MTILYFYDKDVIQKYTRKCLDARAASLWNYTKTLFNTFIALAACQTQSALEIWVALVIYAAIPELPRARNAPILHMDKTERN